ncbi:hypothetical protein [Pendulispora albinea]|uniref:FG-GAP repeat protein n=1 Tax=Pendulispora albinea TaxID=2741071 RepID=A0ABZ2LYL8_9BACT
MALVLTAVAVGACGAGESSSDPEPGHRAANLLAAAAAPQAVLTASDAVENDWFGYQVAIDGDTAVVVGQSTVPGTAVVLYVFTRQGGTWTEQQRFVTGDPLEYGAIALQGDTLAVAAHQGVYVFMRSGGTWSLTQKIAPPASTQGSHTYFPSIAMDGDELVLGWPMDPAGGSNAGAAFVYTRAAATWSLAKKLVASDGAAEEAFGWAVGIEGDRIAVSAPGDDDRGQYSGSVYLYAHATQGWTQQQKLLPSATTSEGLFGYVLSLHGGTLAVGAPGDNTIAATAGAAYAFAESGAGWVEQAKLLPADGKPNLQFGGSIAASGATVVAGTLHAAKTWGEELGGAYVFGRAADGGWTQRHKFTSGDPAKLHSFGYTVAMHGSTCLVGSPVQKRGPGEVYVFGLP